jgi:hypothetical protein
LGDLERDPQKGKESLFRPTKSSKSASVFDLKRVVFQVSRSKCRVPRKERRGGPAPRAYFTKM